MGQAGAYDESSGPAFRRMLIPSIVSLLDLPKRALSVTVATAAIGSVLVVPSAAILGRALERSESSGNTTSVLRLAAAAIGLQALGIALTALARHRSLDITRTGAAKLRHRLLDYEMARPLAELRTEEPSAFGSRLVADVEQVDGLADHLFGNAIPNAVLLAAATIFLVSTDLVLTVAAILCGVPLVLFNRRMRSNIVDLGEKYWASYHHLTERLLRLRRAQTSIIEAGAEEGATLAERPAVDRLRTNGMRLQRTLAVGTYAQSLMIGVAAAGLLVLGSIRYRGSGGTLLSVLYALAIAQNAGRMLATGVLNIAAGRPAHDRLSALLVASVPSSSSADGVALDQIRAIEFDRVSVRFSPDGPPVIRDLTFQCKTGDRVAVLGPNGSGKTTLVRVLTASLPPTSGTVLINGQPNHVFDVRSVRRRIAIVPQQPALVSGTIEDNLRLFGSDAPDRVLNDVLATVGLEFALDAEIGDQATLLSGGQGQRLALARALLGDPDVVVLDEPTNHLDSDGAALVKAFIDARPHALWIIVTHDESITALANLRVLRLHDGRLVA